MGAVAPRPMGLVPGAGPEIGATSSSAFTVERSEPPTSLGGPADRMEWSSGWYKLPVITGVPGAVRAVSAKCDRRAARLGNRVHAHGIAELGEA